MIGKVYGSYRIVQRLGEGGMGTVYEAEHVQVGRRAAIKVLLPEWSNNEVVVERFFNEARSSVLANHPGIVEIFDCGWSDEGSAYLVMELLEGEPLANLLAREGSVPVHRMTAMARQMASALSAAHAKGIVHRDLKPENIFVIPDRYAQGGERIKVLDFGVAKLASARREQIAAGTMLGTPLYMSPEQCTSSADVDERGDIYSLGCIMFELVCGRPPFIDDDPMAVAAMQVNEPPPRPRTFRQELPINVENLILRTLNKDPEQRPQTMADLRAELDVVWSLLPAEGRTSAPVPMPSPAIPVVKVAPTTLGAAASELAAGASTPENPPPVKAQRTSPGKSAPRSGRGLRGGRGRKVGVAIIAAVIAAAAAIAVVLFTRGGDVGPAGQPRSGPAPLESALVVVHIESTPAGAGVYMGGQKVGVTPYESTYPRGKDPLVFQLELDGHHAERVEVAADRNSNVAVALRPVAAAPH